MDDYLKNKVLSWFIPRQTGSLQPAQLAAHAFRCLQVLTRQANTSHESEQVREHLHTLIGLLYRAERVDRGYPMYTTKEAFKLAKRFAVPGTPHTFFLSKENTANFCKETFHNIGDFKQKEFMSRVDRLSQNITLHDDVMFDTLIQEVWRYASYSKRLNAGREKAVILIGLQDLSDGLYGISCHQRDKGILNRLSAIYNPSRGPETVREMLLALAIIADQEKRFLAGSEDDKDVNEIFIRRFFHSIASKILSYCDDVPVDVVDARLQEDVKGLSSVDFSKFDIQIGHGIGLIRYFVLNNQEKLPPNAYHSLRYDLILLYQSYFFKSMEGKFPVSGISGDLREVIKASLNAFEEGLTDYQRPTPDEVADMIIKGIKDRRDGRAAENEVTGFLRQRRSMPSFMEEVVDFYIMEPQEYRFARRNIFNIRYMHNGDDAPRSSFIKGIASRNRAELVSIGIAENDIDVMERDGKIPLKADGKSYNLTVEHIVDREMGGTNHLHNFTLMSQDLNARKDKFKKKQLSALRGSEKGFWIITWQPKKLPDGSYPAILPVTVGSNTELPSYALQPQTDAPRLSM